MWDKNVVAIAKTKEWRYKSGGSEVVGSEVVGSDVGGGGIWYRNLNFKSSGIEILFGQNRGIEIFFPFY